MAISSHNSNTAGQIVRADDDGAPCRAQLPQKVLQPRCGLLIKGVVRFIQKEQLGVVQNGPRNGQTLLHCRVNTCAPIGG